MTVDVMTPVDGQTDPFGVPTVSYTPESVSFVLPQPDSTYDLEADRPDGVRVDMTFHFPLGYSKSLRGCLIQYAGKTYRVIGDPQPSMPCLTPGPFGMKVETERVDG